MALYAFRSVDDNTLTSWRWLLASTSALWAYAAVVLAIALAWLGTRLKEPGEAVLCMVAVVVSVIFWREPEAIIDASRYFTQAKHLSTYGVGFFVREWGGAIAPWTDLPLMPFLYGLGFKVFGEARVVVQAMVTLMFSLTVLLTVRLGRELWDERIGRASGAMLLSVPYLYTQVPLMLVDVPSMFFLTLALYTFVLALRRGGPWVVAAAGAVLACLLTKYSLWLMLSVLPVAFVALVAEDPARYLRRAAAVAALAVVAALPAALYKWDVLASQIDLLLAYQRPGLRAWSESYVSSFLYQTHPFVAAGALWSLWAALKRRDRKYLCVLWPVLLIFVLGVRRMRYIVPVLPMLGLMAAYGISTLRPERLGRFVASSAMAVSVAIALVAYLPFMSSISMKNLHEAGRYIDRTGAGVVKVFALPLNSDVNPAITVPLLDIATRAELLYDYSGPLPPEGLDLKSTPMRFSWEFFRPAYYATEGPVEVSAPVVAVISDRAPPELAELMGEAASGYGKTEVFDAYEQVFRFRTFVTLYEYSDP